MELKSYETLLEEKLAQIDHTMDKRQGSIIYDTLAPNAAESAQMYLAMALLLDRTFGDTATGEDLTRRAAERNIIRKESIASIVKGKFYNLDQDLINVPLGSRFSGGGLNFVVTKKLEQGVFELTCDTAGEIGNSYLGRVIPVDYIAGLATAETVEFVLYGEEEEDDETLRSRYLASFQQMAFGGNIDDYKEKINSFESVGGCKVIPVFQGGGTVKIVIINNGYRAASAELVEEIQTAVDPSPQGTGVGIAPIGHTVTVESVAETEVTVLMQVTFEEGVLWDSVAEDITEMIEEYLVSLAREWQDRSQLVVRISQIETRVLELPGIIDVFGTTVNGSTDNLTLDPYAIPVLKKVAQA